MAAIVPEVRMVTECEPVVAGKFDGNTESTCGDVDTALRSVRVNAGMIVAVTESPSDAICADLVTIADVDTQALHVLLDAPTRDGTEFAPACMWVLMIVIEVDPVAVFVGDTRSNAWDKS